MCPVCREWVALPLRRQQEFRETHKRRCGEQASRRPGENRESATVKKSSLWDGVFDTYQTEGELNGWRPSQGALL